MSEECRSQEARLNRFQALQEEIKACRTCQTVFGFDPHPILFGNPQASIMQISQAPSQNVHKTGKPFNDASGRRLRAEWYRISDDVFYHPDNFYIASIAHCYPGKNPSGGDCRPPKCCAEKWLVHELDLVQNKLYLIVGGVAAAYFFPGKTLTELVFQDLTINDKPTYVLPHPSPLNMLWFAKHPEFTKERLPEIAKTIHAVLGLPYEPQI